jgi:predicted hydrolase (HD superfamily)
MSTRSDSPECCTMPITRNGRRSIRSASSRGSTSAGLPEVAHAVSAHYTKWGVSYDTLLDKALLACDELTGFVGACARVRPDGLASLENKSVVKKLKDKGFAAKVERGEVSAGAEMLGVPLEDHITFVIEALRPFADEVGLGKR